MSFFKKALKIGYFKYLIFAGEVVLLFTLLSINKSILENFIWFCSFGKYKLSNFKINKLH